MANGSEGSNGKWATARSLGHALKDKLAEVLIVLMFLLAGMYVAERVGSGIINQMQEVAKALGAIREAIVLQVEQTKYAIEIRRHEHSEILEKLEDCEEMGGELAICRRKLRDGEADLEAERREEVRRRKKSSAAEKKRRELEGMSP